MSAKRLNPYRVLIIIEGLLLKNSDGVQTSMESLEEANNLLNKIYRITHVGGISTCCKGGLREEELLREEKDLITRNIIPNSDKLEELLKKIEEKTNAYKNNDF